MNIHPGSPMALGSNVTGLEALPLPAVADLPQSIEANKLRLMTNAAIDMTVFSPRARAARSHPAWTITQESP
jgi:hypothetical protein